MPIKERMMKFLDDLLYERDLTDIDELVKRNDIEGLIMAFSWRAPELTDPLKAIEVNSRAAQELVRRDMALPLLEQALSVGAIAQVWIICDCMLADRVVLDAETIYVLISALSLPIGIPGKNWDGSTRQRNPIMELLVTSKNACGIISNVLEKKCDDATSIYEHSHEPNAVDKMIWVLARVGDSSSKTLLDKLADKNSTTVGGILSDQLASSIAYAQAYLEYGHAGDEGDVRYHIS